jgi:hypothetical protein
MIIPLTIILEAQSNVYKLKDEVNLAKNELIEAQVILRKAEQKFKYAERKLWETTYFLQEYNADANRSDETWFELVGIDKNQFSIEEMIEEAVVVEK